MDILDLASQRRTLDGFLQSHQRDEVRAGYAVNQSACRESCAVQFLCLMLSVLKDFRKQIGASTFF
jgi:hypothetical protein